MCGTASGHAAYPTAAGSAAPAGPLAISTREGSVFHTQGRVANTEVPMSERGSASLFEVVFYCVALVALLIWSFGRVELPW